MHDAAPYQQGYRFANQQRYVAYKFGLPSALSG